jgi:mRNA (guanine-N7-)-methyltransferase
MRAFNGWVKATQIQECNPRTKTNNSKGLRVLDLACGKGGDLGKWAHHKRGMQNYVGVDVARGSLKDAAIRVRKMRKRLNRCTFSCADLGHDVPGRLRSPTTQEDAKAPNMVITGEIRT